MKQYQEIGCPQCKKTDLVKNGHSENGTQRYRCKSCKKSFQQDYSYQAWTPGMKDKIDEQILNSSGVRDTARVLKINKNTVISHLKKKNHLK
jgi:transposase-like protein